RHCDQRPTPLWAESASIQKKRTGAYWPGVQYGIPVSNAEVDLFPVKPPCNGQNNHHMKDSKQQRSHVITRKRLKEVSVQTAMHTRISNADETIDLYDHSGQDIKQQGIASEKNKGSRPGLALLQVRDKNNHRQNYSCETRRIQNIRAAPDRFVDGKNQVPPEANEY